MNRIKIFVIVGIVVVLGVLVYFPGQKLAREHVNYMTAVTDHPLLCSSCHIYTSGNKFISKLINEDYYSPFNIAVSNNGKRLYVIAQDTDELMVVDTEKKEVLHKIAIGEHPHSVILDKSGKIAYVSNEWSDNVSVIDLDSSMVIDTLHTGNGPAGLALSSDEKLLYVVNAFGSDLSVIDLSTKEELKRLTTGNNPTGTELSPDGKVLYVTSRRANMTPYGETLISELTMIDNSTHNDLDPPKESCAFYSG